MNAAERRIIEVHAAIARGRRRADEFYRRRREDNFANVEVVHRRIRPRPPRKEVTQ